MSAEIYSFTTHRRLRSLEAEPSRDELWADLERHERAAEDIRRKLGLLSYERGLYESEGQMPLLNFIDGDEL